MNKKTETARALIEPQDKYLFYGFLGLLIFSPLPLGGNRPWALAILETWIFTLAGLWLIAYLRGQVKLGHTLQRSRLVVLAFCLLCLIPVVQILVLPSGLIEAISPETWKLYTPLVELSILPAKGMLSLDPYHTRVELLETIAYTVFFVLMLLIVNSRHRLSIMLYTIIGIGFFEAFAGSFAAISAIAGSGADVASGTFINRNHLAGYLEMCIALGIGLLISQQSRRFISWRRYWLGWLDVFLGPKIIIRILLVVMVIGLVLTKSRMGNMAFFAGMTVAAAIFVINRKNFSVNTVILLGSLVLIDVVILGTFFDLGQVAKRIEQTTLEKERRDEVAIYTTASIGKFPVLGTGAGSFYGVFPQYRSHEIHKFADHVENDYVELVSDMGVLGALPFAFIVGASLLCVLSVQRRTESQFVKGISFGCFMGILSLLIHSFVDFNLHMPANSLLFVVLLGVCWMLRAGVGTRRRL